MRETMILRRTIIYMWLSFFTISSAHLFSFDRLRSYAKYLDWDTLGTNSSGNELWNGIMRDCSRKMSFSCIQKNAYTYLDNTFVERDNITVFEGFVLTRNKLDYETMTKKYDRSNYVDENMVDAFGEHDDPSVKKKDDQPEAKVEEDVEPETKHREEYKTPLEEITSALHEKTVKFLSTRDYELQLPEFFFEGSTVKISPREIDDKGALIRVDFGQRELEPQGRLFFKKIRKFLQNKLLMSFFALLLIIKLIKVKFMFIIPFLFGIGTAKKLFLKLLLFLVPAFAHVFKLCSSYYTNNANKYHHHHHQIAHHHHHVPVPVPVPTYFAPHDHHDHHHDHHHHEEEYEAYDYAHPHIQLRKDMDELREWGIEPIEEPFDDPGLRPIPNHAPLSPVYRGNTFTIPQQVPTSRPPAVLQFQNKYPASIAAAHAQNLAYSGYVDEQNKFNRRVSPAAGTTVPQVSQVLAHSLHIQLPASNPENAGGSLKTNAKTPYNVFPQKNVNEVPQQMTVQQVSRPIQQIVPQRVVQQPQQSQLTARPIVTVASSGVPSNNQVVHEDAFYGPILERLEDIFGQLRFVEESCRERLICSMYKNPPLYSPHSNIVSNELSRDPQELKRGGSGSSASHRFYRYLNAARLGQDGGDCLRTYPCQINTE